MLPRISFYGCGLELAKSGTCMRFGGRRITVSKCCLKVVMVSCGDRLSEDSWLVPAYPLNCPLLQIQLSCQLLTLLTNRDPRLIPKYLLETSLSASPIEFHLHVWTCLAFSDWFATCLISYFSLSGINFPTPPTIIEGIISIINLLSHSS